MGGKRDVFIDGEEVYRLIEHHSLLAEPIEFPKVAFEQGRERINDLANHIEQLITHSGRDIQAYRAKVSNITRQVGGNIEEVLERLEGIGIPQPQYCERLKILMPSSPTSHLLYMEAVSAWATIMDDVLDRKIKEIDNRLSP